MANSSWLNPRSLPRGKKPIPVNLQPIIAIEGDVGDPVFRRILCIKTSRGTEDELLAETQEQLAVERTERLGQWSQALTEKSDRGHPADITKAHLRGCLVEPARENSLPSRSTSAFWLLLD